MTFFLRLAFTPASQADIITNDFDGNSLNRTHWGTIVFNYRPVESI
jgi:hypothetical protein